MNRIAWTDETIELLRRLAAEGLSASQVAYAMSLAHPGATKNAMIGKAHRLGVEWAPRPGGRVPKPGGRVLMPPVARRTKAEWLEHWDAGFERPIPVHRNPRARRTAQPKRPDLRTGPVWVTLADLRADACHFPRGTPKTAGFRYCGAPATIGKYCTHHHALTHYGAGYGEAKEEYRRLAEAAA